MSKEKPNQRNGNDVRRDADNPSNPSPRSKSPGAERIPPQDLDAEMALLGSMMMSREAISEVVPIIGREHSHWFYRPDHQRLFEVLLDLNDDPTKAIDLIVVKDELKRRGIYEDVGGEDYLVQLAESFGDWANAEHYARIVRDKGMLRDLIRTIGTINDDAYAGIEAAGDILDNAEKRIFAVTEKRISKQPEELRDLLDYFAGLLERQQEGQETLTGLTTGLHSLDELTGGFQKGDLIILAARPSMGKTALGLTMAQNAAREGKPILFFSMEMSNSQVAQRILCAEAEVDAQRWRKQMCSHDDIQKLQGALGSLSQMPLYVDDTPGLTAMELRAIGRRMKQKHDIAGIYVDYLQLMHWPGAESRQIEVASISRSLKSLGRELGIPVIAMAQLNRGPEDRQKKRPQMSDLRESGAIEQDADVILLIHRPEYYEPENTELHGKAELIMAKQRNGPVGNIQLSFNKKFTKFRPAHLGPEPAYAGGGNANPF